MEPPATAGAPAGSAPVTRGLVGAQAALTLLALVPASGGLAARFLALSPLRAVAWGRVWMFLSCALFDRRWAAAALNLPLFAVAARPVEIALGSPAFALFLAAASLTAALVVTALSLAAYAALRVGALIFSPLATVAGLNLALLVALKQQLPEHEVGAGGARLRLAFAPVAYIAALFALVVAGQLNPAAFGFALLTFHAAWVYLRYFRTDPMTGARGDASDAFAFATLFPDPVRPFVAVAATLLHLACRPVLALLLTPGGGGPDAAAANGAAKPDLVSSIAQDRTTSLDAERRRVRAMKALDERMAGSQSDSAA